MDNANVFVEAGQLADVSSGVQITGPVAVCFNSIGRLVANSDTDVSGAVCTLPTNSSLQTFDIDLAGADRRLRVLVTLAAKVDVRSGQESFHHESRRLPMKANFPPRTGRAAADQHGVALLEVLVSLLLFSLGILGLIGLQTRAMSYSIDAEDRNRAALLANDVASALWLSRSTVIDTSANSPWQIRVADPDEGGLPSGALIVTPVAGVTNSADIPITGSLRAQQQRSEFTDHTGDTAMKRANPYSSVGASRS